jgi:hypothetical protein
VTGSVGRQPSASKKKLVYTTANPFLFTGRVLIKEGPERYQIVRGTMTSCLLPDPDWQIHSSLIRVNYGLAKAKNSYFTLLGVPILYLPYVTHPVDSDSRQSGLLLPVVGTSSTKGTIVGESIYLVINRSTDATFGTQYFSKRGWSTRAARTSSLTAGVTLTWTSTPAPSPPANISALLSIAKRLPHPLPWQLLPRSPRRRSSPTMTRDAPQASASTATRILKASPR